MKSAAGNAAPAPAGAARFGRRLALTTLAGALLLAATTERAATRDRPPLAVTGGFGEQTCQQCHFEAAVNAGKGGLTLDGVPESYAPGETYALTLTLVHPDMAAAGFELAARFDPSAAQGGTLAPEPDQKDRIAVTTDADIQYAHHLLPGTAPVAADTARWRLLWTAPPEGGAVAFHAVANAANDDNSPLGDYVYTASVVSKPRGIQLPPARY